MHLHDYLTHRQTPWTDNDSSVLFVTPEPPISTAARQKCGFDLEHDLDPDL